MNDPRDDPSYQVGGKGYKPAIDRSTSLADPQAVAKFHERDDVDSSQTAHHHTIGIRQDQAASGAHTHNGKNSAKILKGTTLTGAKGGSVVITSIVAALVKLGATDSTT